MNIEKLSQAFEIDEVTEVTETEESTEEITEESEKANEETEVEKTEETKEAEEEEPQMYTLRNRIDGDKEVTFEELMDFAEQGTDYNRVKDKLSEYREAERAIKQLFPDLENITKLKDALFANEKERIVKEYQDKGYEQEVIDKLLAQDERFKELEAEVDQLDQARETEKIESDLAKETEALNKEFGTDFKSYKDVDKEVKEKASKHEITLSEAYYLINKDTIISDAKKKKQQSMEADISEKKLKSIPKTGGTDKDVKQKSATTKKLEKAFGLN